MTYVQSTAATIKEGYSTVWRHRAIVVMAFAGLMAISLGLIAATPRVFKSGANVLIVNGNARNDPTLSSPDLPTLATSTGVLARVDQSLGLRIPLLTMKKHVTAKPPAYKSGIMRIEYSDSSADRASLVANGVADELARYYNQLSTARYDQDLSALDAELGKQKTRIEQIDTKLRLRGGLQAMPVDDTNTSGSLANDLNAIQTQRALANAELQGDAAQASAAASGVSSSSSAARRDILEADPLYKALQAEASTSSAQLATAHAQYTSRYPGLPQLQAKVQNLQAAVNREAAIALSSRNAYSPSIAAAMAEQRKAQALVQADHAKVAALDGEIVRRTKQLEGQAPLELLRLERDAAMAEYRSISAHRGSTLLDRADALSLGSVVVIDRAIPNEAQTGAGPFRLLAIFGLVSLLLALGSAFIAEQLDPRLRRAAQIESLYGKPVVATLGRAR